MDMSKFDCHALTNAALEKLDGCRFEGTIARVEEDLVWHKWKGRKVSAPIIHFESGHQWIPNKVGRDVLKAAWGIESDRWVGKRMAIFLVVVRTRRNPETGELEESFEKRVAVLEGDECQSGAE
jgi:hypothetical protein